MVAIALISAGYPVIWWEDFVMRHVLIGLLLPGMMAMAAPTGYHVVGK